MTTTTGPTSLISRFAIGNISRQPDGYYRSKLYINASNSNPLISAANPVFSLLERIGLSTTLPPVQFIRKNIEHELFAFQSRLIQKNYAEECITIANYLLRATVDELIGKNYFRVFQTGIEFKAFTPLSLENKSPEKLFFEIVNFLKEKAHQYLDLLELAYYCLITGFEGEKHILSDGRQSLDNLIDELYQLINLHRVHKFKQPSQEKKTMQPRKNINYRRIILTTIAMIGVALSGLCLSQFLLEHKAKEMMLIHQSLSYKMDAK